MSNKMNFTLSLTHDCQFRCTYCYAGKKHHKVMPKTTIDQAISFLFTHSFDQLEYGFFGGEPLLEWDNLQYATKQIEALAKEKKIATNRTITTNGALLTEENVQWLRQEGFYMVISLDGNEAMHNTHRHYPDQSGTFQDVVKGLHMLQKHYTKTEYAINMVVTPKNIQHLSDSVKYLYHELNIEDISIADDLYDSWDDVADLWEAEYQKIADFYIDVFRQNKRIKINFINDKISTGLKGGYNACETCSFGEKDVIVAPSGNLYPCERLIGNDDDQNMILGNVFEGYDIKKKFQLLSQRGNTNEECKTCEFESRCINFCGCTNYTATQSINTAFGTLCFNQKISIEAADHVLETLFQERNPLFMKIFYDDDQYLKSPQTKPMK